MRPAGIAIALVSGVIFGFGLAIAQMTDPQKVKDFLDVAAIPTGGWDPSLVFVLGFGVVVAFFGLRIDRLSRRPIAAPAFLKSMPSAIDGRLIFGSAIFGVGWGIAGLCPGPSIADLGLVPVAVLPFVIGLLGGSWLTGETLALSSGRRTLAVDPAE